MPPQPEGGITVSAVPKLLVLCFRRSGRVAEGAPLLREYTLIAYRGFESLLLRHILSSKSLQPLSVLVSFETDEEPLTNE